MASKKPGPDDPALVHTKMLFFVTWLISNSYWSVGVMENRRQDKHLLGMQMEITIILFSWTLRDLDHYSNTPSLSPSRRPYEPEANTP